MFDLPSVPPHFHPFAHPIVCCFGTDHHLVVSFWPQGRLAWHQRVLLSTLHSLIGRTLFLLSSCILTCDLRSEFGKGWTEMTTSGTQLSSDSASGESDVASDGAYLEWSWGGGSLWIWQLHLVNWRLWSIILFAVPFICWTKTCDHLTLIK